MNMTFAAAFGGIVIAVLLMTFSSGRNSGRVMCKLDDMQKHFETFTRFMINMRCENTELKHRITRLERITQSGEAIDLDHPKEDEKII